MSSLEREVNVQIHGNSLILRGDSLRPGALQVRETNLSALSLSAPQSSSGADAQAEEQGGSQYLLLTLSDSSQETHEAIQATGAAVLNYITDGVFLYKRGSVADTASLQSVRGVRFVDVYPASVKVHADLRLKISALSRPEARRITALEASFQGASSSAAPASATPQPEPSAVESTITLEIHFHKGTSEPAMQTVLNRFSSTGCLQRDSVQMFSSMAVATVVTNQIDELAAAPEIYVLQRKLVHAEDNVFATDVLGVTGPILLDSGYQIALGPAANPGEPSLPYDGSGETICVGDTGFDRGSTADMTDFTDLHPAFSNRAGAIDFYCMDAAHNANQPNGNMPAAIAASCVIDVKGHGTHVCGSAVGSSQQPSPSGAGNASYIKGSAPGARLVFTQLRTHDPVPKDKPFYGGPMLDIYRKTVSAVATGSPRPIFSQSWGVDWKGEKTPKPGYDVNVETFDTAIRDEDTLVCRSAGNDGDAKDYLGVCGRYAAGKNVLTVGSCQSSTSQWAQAYPDVTSNAAKDPQPRVIPGNPRVLAPSSCSGTHEGRQKPDVVAPGVMILSALSRDAGPPLSAALDSNYCFKSGTSMATPLAAGCAAVINQALRATDPKYPGHSGTLLKALIINGAVSIMDPKGNDPDPQIETGQTRRWGFGRVNVLGALRHLPVPAGVADDGMVGAYRRGTVTFGGKETWTLDVSKPERTPGCLVDDSTRPSIKITLCFADQGNKDLQALFYFTLTQAGTGKVRFGNRRGWFSKDEAKDPKKRPKLADSFNNVQQIFCTDVEPGTYSINIQYFKNNTGQVPGPTVPYAVAWLVF